MSAIVENATTKDRVDKYFHDFNEVKKDMTEVRVPTVRAPLSTTFKSENPDLVNKLSELEIKYVVGEIQLADFEAFLSNEYFPAAEEMEKEYIEWMTQYENSQK